MYLNKKIVNMLTLYPFYSFVIITIDKLINTNISKIYELIIVISLIVLLKFSKNKLILTFIILINLLNSVINPNMVEMTLTYRLIVTLIILSIFSNNEIIYGFKDIININKDKIYKGIILVECLLFISLFLPNSFVESWGREKYFVSSFQSSHNLSYFLLGMLGVVLCLKINNVKKISNIHIFYFIGFIMLTGARTALVIAVIISCINLKWDLKYNVKWLLLTTLCFIFLSLFFIKSGALDEIPFFKKIEHSIKNKSFSSGRDEIVESSIKGYENLNIMEKIIGKGMYYPFHNNQVNLGSSIWSHNDFMQLLLANGLIGLAIYIYILYRCIIMSKCNKVLIISTTVLVLLNGLFSYINFIFIFPYFLVIDPHYIERGDLDKYNE